MVFGTYLGSVFGFKVLVQAFSVYTRWCWVQVFGAKVFAQVISVYTVWYWVQVPVESLLVKFWHEVISVYIGLCLVQVWVEFWV